MRLIVKEYILQLKEKDELDTLLSQIFEEKGYAAVSQPRTGNRQYGVDIQLHNKEELIFLVIKQGDIDRKVWDGDTNAVRQSLVKHAKLPHNVVDGARIKGFITLQ